MKPIPISPVLKQYAWGNFGEDSLVYQLADEAQKSLATPTTPYAELWYGAHPKFSSLHQENQTTLSSIIDAHKEEILGNKVLKRFGNLPFLFKALSVRSALSIQAHPDAELAKRLNEIDPINYPDASHKPELAYAISDVILLHGFKPPEEIALLLNRWREFHDLIGEQTHDSFLSRLKNGDEAAALKIISTAIFSQPPDKIERCCKALYQDLHDKSVDLLPEEEWILKISNDYPKGDVGIFGFFIFNLEQLNPGEVIFISPNVPHAYLAGDLLECMACSDNVVRAGLTQKHCDVETLLMMLDYSSTSLHRLDSNRYRSSGKSFVPPAAEFELHLLKSGSYTIQDAPIILCSISGESILYLATAGEPSQEMILRPGEAVLIPHSINSATHLDVSGMAVEVCVNQALLE
jgi:mannose-6-phosphate isomerase